MAAEKMILTGLILLTVSKLFTNADIQTYKMEDYCGAMINMILDSVYQIKLQLDDNYSLQYTQPVTCQTMVEPWYTWPNLMFYFEDLDLDCRLGYLQFFQNAANATRVKGLEDDVCGDQKPEGVFTLGEERFLQIRYVPLRKQYIEGVFSIIITAYTEEPCPVHSFKCDNSRCIDREIRCEGYDSCGDGSGCRFDLSSAAIAAIIISSLVGLFVLVLTVTCVVCCMKKNKKLQGSIQNGTQHGVVYTATTSSTGVICPPAYDPGQSGQIRSDGVSSINPEPYNHTTSPLSVPPLNITAGQSPAYPPNWTMPSYHKNVFRNPPPYEEIQPNLPENNDLSDRERENTDNNVLENTTSAAVCEETDSRPVEKPTDNNVIAEPQDSQLREVTTNREDKEEASDDVDQEEDSTHEITNHALDEPATQQGDSENQKDMKGVALSISDGYNKDIAMEVKGCNQNCVKSEMSENETADTFEDIDIENKCEEISNKEREQRDHATE